MASEGLTAAQRRVLAVLESGDVMRPGDVARALWPESPTRQGQALAIGVVLARLKRAGFVTRLTTGSLPYRITPAGRRALDEAGEEA